MTTAATNTTFHRFTKPYCTKNHCINFLLTLHNKETRNDMERVTLLFRDCWKENDCVKRGPLHPNTTNDQPPHPHHNLLTNTLSRISKSQNRRFQSLLGLFFFAILVAVRNFNVLNRHQSHYWDETTFGRPGGGSAPIKVVALPTCTRRQLKIIQQQLPPDGCSSNRFNCSIRMATRCPNPIWLHEYYFSPPPPQPLQLLPPPQQQQQHSKRHNGKNKNKNDDNDDNNNDNNEPPPAIGIYLGCNKGIDAVHTLRTLSYNKVFNPQRWRNVLDPHKVMKGGACNQALLPKTRHEMEALLFSDPTRARMEAVAQFESTVLSQALSPSYTAVPLQRQLRNAQVYCVEAMPGLAQLLETTAKTLHWDNVFHVIPAAMSDADGTALFPDFLVELGFEAVSLANCQKLPVDETCQTVPLRSLDSLVETHIFLKTKEDTIHNNNKQVLPLIDILVIDVEGYDFEVLMGANETLTRTKYLEFEINDIGLWPTRSLATAIDLLSHKGFACYWTGSGGHLWRITGCFQSYYESKVWSNVACVNRNLWDTNDPLSLPSRMEAQFQETLAAGNKVGYQNVSKDGTDGIKYCTKECRKRFRRLKKTGM
jgi:FkbM family methyltransferase